MSMDWCLRYTNVSLELISDSQIFKFLERSMRGQVFVIQDLDLTTCLIKSSFFSFRGLSFSKLRYADFKLDQMTEKESDMTGCHLFGIFRHQLCLHAFLIFPSFLFFHLFLSDFIEDRVDHNDVNDEI